ncbi:MAG: hypothetical protein WC871_02195 [Bacteroidales bacterium]|jgi:hypothetical protein
MKIDIEKLADLVAKSDEIFLTPAGEKHLLKLLEIKNQVDMAIDAAKLVLEQAAQKLDPNFSSIQGDKIKVSYRHFGAKYYLDEPSIDQIDPELYKVIKRYSVNAKAVEDWAETHKGMPAGIKEVERKKQITFQLKKGAK